MKTNGYPQCELRARFTISDRYQGIIANPCTCCQDCENLHFASTVHSIPLAAHTKRA